MSIQAKINELKPYVSGFKFYENKVIVEINLKKHWQKPNKKSEGLAWVNDDKDKSIFYVVGDESKVGVDGVLEHVKKVININVEQDKKNQLFKQKIEELKAFFKANNYEDLSTMEFVINKKFETPTLEEETEETFYNSDDIDDELNKESEPKTPTNNENVNLTHKTGLGHPKETAEEKKVEQPKKKPEVKKVDETIRKTNLKGQNIDLPKKGEKVELQEFNAPEVPDV